jgi:hypothetical protein
LSFANELTWCSVCASNTIICVMLDHLAWLWSSECKNMSFRCYWETKRGKPQQFTGSCQSTRKCRVSSPPKQHTGIGIQKKSSPYRILHSWASPNYAIYFFLSFFSADDTALQSSWQVQKHICMLLSLSGTHEEAPAQRGGSFMPTLHCNFMLL